MARHAPASFSKAVGGTPAFWIGTALLSLVVAYGVSLFLEPALGPRSYPAENGPIEILQEVLLLGSIAALVMTFLRSSPGGVAVFSLILAYVLFHATVRELPRCDSAFYEGGPCFPSEWKDWTRLAVSALALLALALKRIDWRAMEWTRDRSWILPLAAAAALLAAGQVASSFIYVRLEEILELAGYLILLVLSLNVLARDLARSRRVPERDG